MLVVAFYLNSFIMNRYFKFFIPVLAIVLFSCAPSQRYKSDDSRYGNVLNERNSEAYNNRDWNRLASVKVAPRKEQKSINVKRRDGKDIRELMFRTDDDINVYSVDVKYSNGRSDQLSLRPGMYDRRQQNNSNDLVVYVPDHGRARVTEIIFWYDVTNRSLFSKRPAVEVFAR